MAGQFELVTSRMHARISDGLLTSIMPGANVSSARESGFFRADQGTGKIRVVYEMDGQRKKAETGAVDEESYEETNCGCALMTRFSRNEDLYQENLWSADDGLTWTLRICNVSGRPVHILDLGLLFSFDSDFAWGGKAADKVIAKLFVGGHGTRITAGYCDGHGPLLLITPRGSTRMLYMTPEGKRGAFALYPEASTVREEAERQGARLHLPSHTCMLASGEKAEYVLRFAWAEDQERAREMLAGESADIQVLPGMTVPRGEKVRLSVDTAWENPQLQLPEGASLLRTWEAGKRSNYEICFRDLGEQTVWLVSGDGRSMNLDFFSTEPLSVMLRKRGAFIAAHQHRDPDKWYDGLLAEWSNDTHKMLGPDDYDRIHGWRIYEVTCDDPGLSKPAFLAAKNAEIPEEAEIRALDRYVERFVWGGLQCTEEEEYPYAIYGIPDWKQLRDSPDPDVKGREHIWRIYDYPHLALMYFSLYRIVLHDPAAPLTQDRLTYLCRAARTLIAMYTVPLELDGWSAFGTGLYNELVTEEILDALEHEQLRDLKRRLERLWNRKAYTFVHRQADVFGSEYPFDTTGFESTQALADRAQKISVADSGARMEDREISPVQAEQFLHRQMQCNIACRGVLEPGYGLYGSDIRGDNLHYTLSYMSQMGGWAVMQYALYHAENPFPYLRLGYGSLMSSWALLNSGDARSAYGFWYPGKESDGAAGGGFEPSFLGETWLQQKHHGGSWYYSCEIDLGYCGYLRGACSYAALDPLFGPVLVGAHLERAGNRISIRPADGVRRRMHFITMQAKMHVLAENAQIEKLTVNRDSGILEMELKPYPARKQTEVQVALESRCGRSWSRQACQDTECSRDGEHLVLCWPMPDWIGDLADKLTEEGTEDV